MDTPNSSGPSLNSINQWIHLGFKADERTFQDQVSFWRMDELNLT